MFMKSGFIAIVLMLSVIFAGELVVLSEQNSPESATPQTQVLNDTSGGKASTQTPQDPVTQKMQSSNDITEENLSTGIRIFGIHFDPTIRLDVLLSVIIGLFGVVITLLIFIFGSKTRSKSPPELIIEVVSKPENAGIEIVSKPENASEVEEYIKAIDRNPKATLVEKAIADAYVLQRGEKIKEAIEKWCSVANIAEGNDKALAVRAWASVGFLYINEGMGAEALDALGKALNLKPDSAEIYNGRGIAKLMLERYQDAVADWDEAIRLKPDYAEAYNNRGTTKNLCGRHQDALVDYDIAIRLRSGNAQTYNKRGLTKYLLKKHKDALADYDTAIRLKTDYAEAYYYRGHANSALKKYEAALADYSKAIELGLDDPAAYSNRGFIHFKLGQCRKAITDYNEAIRLKSDETGGPHIQGNSISFSLEDTKFDEAEVYTNRGVAKSQLGEYEEALADYDEAIRLKPNYAETYYNRGLTNTLLGKHQDSLTDYNEAIRLKPDYVEAYINRGPTNLILGEYAEALVDLNEVIRLQPNFVLAYVNRAEAKVNLNRIDEARSDFQTALELAEQQNNTALKTDIEKRLQELNNSTP